MFRVPEQHRVINGAGAMNSTADCGNNGLFMIPLKTKLLRVIASDEMGWEHVSVSLRNRCPNWKEMNAVKNLFWSEEDAVMQLHPPKSEYVNCHPNVLHLWRPTNETIPRPPTFMVGPLT